MLFLPLLHSFVIEAPLAPYLNSSGLPKIVFPVALLPDPVLPIIKIRISGLSISPLNAEFSFKPRIKMYVFFQLIKKHCNKTIRQVTDTTMSN